MHLFSIARRGRHTRSPRRGPALAIFFIVLCPLAVWAFPEVIIKADDLRYKASTTVAPEWQRFVDYIEEKRISASIGIVTDSMEGAGGDYYAWIRAAQRRGRIEFWNHGYQHSRDTGTPTAWWEFKNTTYEEQKESFERGQTLAREKLGFPFRTFGASWNQTDATTVQVLEESPEIKVWLYGDAAATSSKLVLPRISDVNIEQPVHVPNLSYFEEHYPLYSDQDVLVIQGHPADWDTDESFSEFVGIIDYLETQGAVFVTPTEYYQIVNPAGFFFFELELPSEEGTRYQWERSENMIDWERFGERFFGTGEVITEPIVYRGEPPASFFRYALVPADEPLYRNTFEELSGFNDLSPAVATSEAGVVLVDGTTTPPNLAGAGFGMRFYDLSASAGVRAFDDLALSSAFKMELVSYNNRYDTENTFHGPTLRFGNTGAGLQSSANAAFYINYRKDDRIRAYFSGGNADVVVAPDVPHTVVLYVNSAMEGFITYEGPLMTRTLGPMSFDVYVDDVMVGSSENGLPFINPSGYTPADGIGRFGFNTSSTHTGADFTFDDLSISPLP